MTSLLLKGHSEWMLRFVCIYLMFNFTFPCNCIRVLVNAKIFFSFHFAIRIWKFLFFCFFIFVAWKNFTHSWSFLQPSNYIYFFPNPWLLKWISNLCSPVKKKKEKKFSFYFPWMRSKQWKAGKLMEGSLNEWKCIYFG